MQVRQFDKRFTTGLATLSSESSGSQSEHFEPSHELTEPQFGHAGLLRGFFGRRDLGRGFSTSGREDGVIGRD
jgi:hypothetical protein